MKNEKIPYGIFLYDHKTVQSTPYIPMIGFNSFTDALFNSLTYLKLMFPSYRNKSTDLLCKWFEWFLYQWP